MKNKFIKDSYSEFAKALEFQTVAPWVLSAQIPEKYYREAYNKLVDSHEEFSFAIFTKLPKYWNDKETKQFINSKKNILIRPILISSAEFRKISIAKFQESKNNRFNIQFNEQYKKTETILFLKALCHILKIWKSLAKQAEFLRIESENKEEAETRGLSVRLSNKFDSNKFAKIMAQVSGCDLHLKKDRYFLYADYEEIVFIENISATGQYTAKKDDQKGIFKKIKGPEKEVQITCIPKPISLEEKLKDSFGNFYNRYLIRSITISERITLSLGSSDVSLPAANIPVITEEAFHNFRTKRFFKKYKDPQTRTELLQKNPQIRSLLLVLNGNKYFYCCSDTLKNNIPISSNHFISFTNSGNSFTGYKMSNGQLHPYYKVQGGGEILIDAALIPKNSIIVALRSLAADPSFLGITNFAPKKADKARAVAYRNHEVHIQVIPKRAVLCWHPDQATPWVRKIPAPLIRDIRSEKVFTATLENRTVLEDPNDIKEKPRHTKRKRNLEEKVPEKKLCVESPSIPQKVQQIDHKIYASSNPFPQQGHSSAFFKANPVNCSEIKRNSSDIELRNEKLPISQVLSEFLKILTTKKSSDGSGGKTLVSIPSSHSAS